MSSDLAITLPQAVEFIRQAILDGDAGEIWVPKLPAFTLADLFWVMSPQTCQYKVIGLRPGGEKLHESLLSEEEIRRTRDHGGVYIVTPSHHSWAVQDPVWTQFPTEFRYTSETAPRLSVDALRELCQSL